MAPVRFGLEVSDKVVRLEGRVAGGAENGLLVRYNVCSEVSWEKAGTAPLNALYDRSLPSDASLTYSQIGQAGREVIG